MTMEHAIPLTCHCNTCGSGDSTCISDYKCLAVVNTGQEYPEKSCMNRAEGRNFQCRMPNANCCNTPLCNENPLSPVTTTLPVEAAASTDSIVEFTPSTNGSPAPITHPPVTQSVENHQPNILVGTLPPTNFVDDSQRSINISLGVTIPLLVAFLFLGIVVKIKRKRARRNPNDFPGEEMEFVPKSQGQVLGLNSGSGRGMPVLRERTIASLVELLDIIGQGSYGRVYKAAYQNSHVAVKVFLSKDETNFERERKLYCDISLRHENVLGFRDCDITYDQSVTQFWIITDYHPQGSLYDYLQTNRPLKMEHVLRMLISACSGLNYLHHDVRASRRKPAIAHRDVKTKNILVKNDGTCCIADLGLAISRPKPDSKELEDLETNVGTKRYIAPEIADSSINKKQFESFISTDVYSFSLAIWEVLVNCSQVSSYVLPYHDKVGDNPDFEAMEELISVQKYRPPIQFDPLVPAEVQTKLRLLMESSWCAKPTQRVSISRLEKYLQQALSETDQGSYTPMES